MICPPDIPISLNRDPCPYVRPPGQFLPQLSQPPAALCENLVHMPVRANHHIEYPVDILIRDIPVEQIRHRIDKNSAWALPLQRYLKPLRPQAQFKPLLIWVPRHATKTFGECQSIAVITAGADLSTAGNRVPSGVCPFYGSPIAHISTPVVCQADIAHPFCHAVYRETTLLSIRGA